MLILAISALVIMPASMILAFLLGYRAGAGNPLKIKENYTIDILDPNGKESTDDIISQMKNEMYGFVDEETEEDIN